MNFFKRYFFSQWDLLEKMEFHEWYMGSALAVEHGFPHVRVFDKLLTLKDEGYVEDKREYMVFNTEEHGEIQVIRILWKRTGKRKPQPKEKTQSFLGWNPTPQL